jgi:hypothetical protein
MPGPLRPSDPEVLLMRKTLQLLTLALTVVALGSLAAIGQAAGRRSSKAQLLVVSSHPLTIAGRHFKPGSHVRVTLSWVGQTTKRVTVKRSGRFTVVFSTVVDRCTQWTVKATQPGHAPLFKRGPSPQCTPAGTP